MDAVTRVLKAINHEEPDRVPAFESAFTNDTIRKHYGFDTGSGAAEGLAAIQKLPNPMETARYFLSNREFQTKGYSDAYKFLRKVKIDIGLSLITQMPRLVIEGGMIDEYGRIMMLEPAKEDGTLILGYRGGHFKNFEDYENWERPDPEDPIRMAAFLAGKDVQIQMENEIFSVPAIAGMMEVGWEPFGLEVFSRILARPKQAKKVFDDQGKLALEITKILAENDAQMILIWDDYGYKNGLFMSPQNYRTYVFPWLRKICAAAHKHDCKILLQSDGDLITIFDDIINCGVDALN
ncbi:MAG: uroporphyrinogen decarboxylase family protein, partial [Promethearchaeota archaeon]